MDRLRVMEEEMEGREDGRGKVREEEEEEEEIR